MYGWTGYFVEAVRQAGRRAIALEFRLNVLQGLQRVASAAVAPAVLLTSLGVSLFGGVGGGGGGGGGVSLTGMLELTVLTEMLRNSFDEVISRSGLGGGNVACC